MIKIAKDLVRYSLKNLMTRKLRSFLSVLSILIGIMAIFALTSFGQGIKSYIDVLAKEQGTDKLLMQPKGTFAPSSSATMGFTQDDLDFVKKINGVEEAAGIEVESVKIKFKEYREKYVYAAGLSTDPKELKLIKDTLTVKTAEGRDLKKGDIYKVMLGYNYLVPGKLFKRALSVGDTVEINDISFEVVGFFEEIGNPSDDSQVYLTKEGMSAVFGDKNYYEVIIQASPDQNPSDLADKIQERFRKHRNQKEGQEDFYVQTFEEVVKTFTSIIDIFNAILIMIALVSVLVASVNIMNTMYTAVLERTREIGVMKSIGASNEFILAIFVLESGFLGLIGGIFGVILGYVVAQIGGLIAKLAGLGMLRPAFPIWLTAGCLVFAFVVGTVSGYLPAKQASKLKPVDALRYE